MQCKKCLKHGCVHYLTRFRHYAGQVEPKKVEGCVFHLMLDELENHAARLSMVQAEMGQTKQAALLQAIGSLSVDTQAKEELRKLIQHNFRDTQRLLT